MGCSMHTCIRLFAKKQAALVCLGPPSAPAPHFLMLKPHMDQDGWQGHKAGVHWQWCINTAAGHCQCYKHAQARNLCQLAPAYLPPCPMYVQGVPRRSKKLPVAPDSKLPQPDPTLVCCAYGKQRLYLFSQREPQDTEDAAAARQAGQQGRAACWALGTCTGPPPVSTSPFLQRRIVLHTDSI
jgi:hypothetical protein